jgi:hypothetical protein
VRFERRCTVAYLIVCAMLAGSALGFRAAIERLNVFLRKEAVPLRESLDSIPVVLGSWERVGDDVRYGADVETELGTKQYLLRTYQRPGTDGAGRVQLHIAYYTGLIDTVPHVPERCWGAAGMIMTQQPHDVALRVDASAWPAGDARNASTGQPYPITMVQDPVTRREQRVHLPLGDWVASVTEFQEQGDMRHRVLGGYFFVANGRMTSSPYQVRNLAFDLTDQYAYYCKVQCTMVLPFDGSTDEAFSAAAGDLLRQAMPEIMRCLPDWPSWEGGSGGTASTPKAG